jgi:hypothetical protein
MHVRRIGLAALGMCALVACSVNWPEQLENDRLACNTQFPEKKGSFVTLATCLNNADERHWVPNSADSDMIRAFDDTRLKLAETADAGTITQDDFDHQLASRQSMFKSEMERRDNERLHQSWSISHGLDQNSKPDPTPVPVTPPN